MSVLLPNTTAGIRRVTDGVTDAYGGRTNGGWGALSEMRDARVKENSDGTWSLGVDPALWPVRIDDLIITSAGMSYLVKSSALLQNNYDDTVDWVRVTALQRGAGGTEPGGAWYVGRTLDHVDPDASEDPALNRAGLWVGDGPPTAEIEGAKPGDEYLDRLTGLIYQLAE